MVLRVIIRAEHEPTRGAFDHYPDSMQYELLAPWADRRLKPYWISSKDRQSWYFGFSFEDFHWFTHNNPMTLTKSTVVRRSLMHLIALRPGKDSLVQGTHQVMFHIDSRMCSEPLDIPLYFLPSSTM